MLRYSWFAAVVLAVASSRVGAQPVSSLVVFGDSLSDTGNLLARTTGSFIDPRPAPPCYSLGRFTSGADTSPPAVNLAHTGTWHEQLAGILGIPAAVPHESNPSGNNWAFGGATSASGFGLFGFFDNVGKQVDDYLAGKPTIPADPLYVVWAGANDVVGAASAASATPATIAAAGQTALTNLAGYVDALADKGAKRILWPNLPPLDRVPFGASLSPTLRDAVGNATAAFRDGQLPLIAAMEAEHAGLDVIPLNIYGQFESIFAAPGSHGLTNVTDPVVATTLTSITVPCQRLVPADTNPDLYLFWDSLHPTTTGHRLVAELAATSIPEPAGLWILAFGAMLVSRCKRRIAN